MVGAVAWVLLHRQLLRQVRRPLKQQGQEDGAHNGPVEVGGVGKGRGGGDGGGVGEEVEDPPDRLLREEVRVPAVFFFVLGGKKREGRVVG